MATTGELKPVYLRRDLGHRLCVHVGATKGEIGFSLRENFEDTPSRPGFPDFWLDYEKTVILHHLLDRVVKAHNKEPELPTPPPKHASTSGFLQANVQKIVSLNQGYLKDAPWWLRWLYPTVVTKEEYRD